MKNKIKILSSFTRMSAARSLWIREFIEFILTPSIMSTISSDDILEVDITDPPSLHFNRNDIVIGHEIPRRYAKTMNASGIRYIDIRVSPVRFCPQDNLLAIKSNDKYIMDSLARYRISDHGIQVEARALALSFRYRDLGQFDIQPGSIAIFTEQPVDQDSINYEEDQSMEKYRDVLNKLIQKHSHAIYCHRGRDEDPSAAVLSNLGVRRSHANIYAILGSSNVTSVAALRGGVLEEARYFGKQIIALDRPTTPIMDDSMPSAEEWYVHVQPTDALSRNFWPDLLDLEVRAMERKRDLESSQNILRRAMNNWNSSATGIEMHGQYWRDLVGIPIEQSAQSVLHEVDHMQALRDHQLPESLAWLKGRWQWFTGEVITVFGTGHVRAPSDFGHIEYFDGRPVLHWHRRALQDSLVPSASGTTMHTSNQYGGGGEAIKLP